MTPEQWRQIDRLFHSALERKTEERAAFLDQACGGDEEMRREIESLLAADAEAESVTKAIPAQVAAEMLTENQAQPVIGQQINHYRILSQLGAGGMGEVYLAQDTKLGRKIALKLLPVRFTQDAERVRRFEQEARAASTLNHPNIITIHEIGKTEEMHYLITEYIEGETLRQQMVRERMSLTASLDAAMQIASALAAAHGAGIIHRDIKPENVMLRPDGLVKVLDFGLAKLTERYAAAIDTQAPTIAGGTTEPGVVLGTASYMSPEQARGQKVDARTDIFSLGAVLYEMLAGQRPFAGATAGDTIAAILRDEPLPLSEYSPDCPAPLERIVNRCLAKAPEQRYQSAGELSAELKVAREAIEEDRRSMRVVGEELTASRGMGKSSSQRRRLAAIGGAVALIALMAALYYFRIGRNAAETPIRTIAVLPPRPLQSGERDEALELGTTSTLITRLGSLRQLIVRPESAVEKYARPEQDPLAAGREQKVDAVLDSRYQRSGDKLRFRLRLLRVADGVTLWADTLDQQAADLFAIEDALSAKVTGALRLTLSSADKELMAKRYTNSAEAWQLYIRGRHLLHQRHSPDTEKAITYFQRAIALDPGFALAHALLGYSYASLSYSTYPAKEFMPKAKAAYDQALKLDDQLAEAHTYLALYKHYYEWDLVGAEQGHRRAIDLNPNSADVRRGYAMSLTYMGRFDQAIPEIRRAEELDPTSPHISSNVAQALFFARRYDEAIEQSRRAAELNPTAGTVYNWMIAAYQMKGDEQGAFAARLKQAEANGEEPGEITRMKAAFATGGLKGFLRRSLDRVLEREKNGFVIQINIAQLYALLGEKEQALARLHKAVEDRNLYVVALKVEPRWDSYRADPRFVALVQRVGLAP